MLPTEVSCFCIFVWVALHNKWVVMNSFVSMCDLHTTKILLSRTQWLQSNWKKSMLSVVWSSGIKKVYALWASWGSILTRFRKIRCFSLPGIIDGNVNATYKKPQFFVFQSVVLHNAWHEWTYIPLTFCWPGRSSSQVILLIGVATPHMSGWGLIWCSSLRLTYHSDFLSKKCL